MLQPQIILMKAGTDTSQGIPQLVANINACCGVADLLRSTLGPMGMDKLIKKGESVTISNDGATLITLLEVVHPAARVLTEVAKAQDEQVGDGTTSVVLLSAELLRNAKEFVQDGVPPQIVIKGYQKAASDAIAALEDLKLSVNQIAKDFAQRMGAKAILNEKNEKTKNEIAKCFLLEQCAKTALTSKLIESDKDFFSKMLVSSFIRHPPSDRDGADFFEIKTINGGSIKDSFLVDGVAFQKTFSYAGFEQQPKKFKNPKIALVNLELEVKPMTFEGEVRVNPGKLTEIVDAESQALYNNIDKIIDSGANIVLTKEVIGDLATQYFAEKGLFAAGRVQEKDIRRVAAFSGASVQTSLDGLKDKNALGTCEQFEERQLGDKRFNFFTGAKCKNLVTLILRGGAEQYIAEASRSLNDAIMVVKNAVRCSEIVSGGGSTEMELSLHLKKLSNVMPSKAQLMYRAFAKSLEVIPRSLALNAGIDSTDILNELRCCHHKGEKYAGVDIQKGGAGNSLESFVWEPAASKRNMIEAAVEAACGVLSIDETIKTAPSEQFHQERQYAQTGQKKMVDKIMGNPATMKRMKQES